MYRSQTAYIFDVIVSHKNVEVPLNFLSVIILLEYYCIFKSYTHKIDTTLLHYSMYKYNIVVSIYNLYVTLLCIYIYFIVYVYLYIFYVSFYVFYILGSIVLYIIITYYFNKVIINGYQ